MAEERERRERDRERDGNDEVNDLIEDELKALDGVMEAIEPLHVASKLRVLKAGEALLPPAVTTPLTQGMR